MDPRISILLIFWLLTNDTAWNLSGPLLLWHADLPFHDIANVAPGSITMLGANECNEAFLQHFHSIRSVAFTELTQIELLSHERVAEFINRWHSLSSHCLQSIIEPNQKAILNIHEQLPSRNGCIFATVCGLLLLKIGIKGHKHREHYCQSFSKPLQVK